MNIIFRLNIFLVLSTQAFIICMLWLGSSLEWFWSIPIGVITSFILLTNYALIHEATHNNLHNSSSINRLLGTLSGWLFPTSFTFLHIAHQVHHYNNRTDHEMFDYYYPTDNLLIKKAQWYSILIGIYPPIIPIGSILMAFIPSFFNLKPFIKARSSSVLFANQKYNSPEIKKIRVEVIFGIIYWLVLVYGLSLNLLSIVIIYACFCFNWSTRQYVTHAFTQRHVIDGALNLKVSRLMGWILLNSQWDQVHHKYPTVPWMELPKYANKTMEPISYWKQYLRLWKGPQPNKEPAPEPLSFPK